MNGRDDRSLPVRWALHIWFRSESESASALFSSPLDERRSFPPPTPIPYHSLNPLLLATSVALVVILPPSLFTHHHLARYLFSLFHSSCSLPLSPVIPLRPAWCIHSLSSLSHPLPPPYPDPILSQQPPSSTPLPPKLRLPFNTYPTHLHTATAELG